MNSAAFGPTVFCGGGEYPLLRVLRLAVSPLRRVTFFKRQKGNRKGLLLRSALAGSGSFAPGLIRAQRLRFASLHLLPLCSTASNGRCAPTPGSIPPLSLPTSPVDQDQEHSSLRSLLSGAASPRAAALLCFSVGVSLLAIAPCQPTHSCLMYINPVGAGLPAKAASQPTTLCLTHHLRNQPLALVTPAQACPVRG